MDLMKAEGTAAPERPAVTGKDVWLGRYAAWGMPVAYFALLALASLGLKLPSTIVLKLIAGGGAFWLLHQTLKADPANRYAAMASKIVRIQIGLMLAVEVIPVVIIFLVSDDRRAFASGVAVMVGIAVHIAVAIAASHKLGNLRDEINSGVVASTGE
jgi:hypothetical protein